jgi:hypothetical protein
METAIRRQEFAVGAILAPALRRISEDHFVSVSGIVDGLERSFCLGSARTESLARGLCAGFSFDFMAAAYLLVPFVEAFVRRLCVANGIEVRRPIAGGTQEFISLEGLLGHPELSRLLGEPLTLHLKCLLTDRHGANLRNELMHGILPDGAAGGWPSAMVWWTVLHVAFRFQYRATSADEGARQG